MPKYSDLPQKTFQAMSTAAASKPLANVQKAMAAMSRARATLPGAFRRRTVSNASTMATPVVRKETIDISENWVTILKTLTSLSPCSPWGTKGMDHETAEKKKLWSGNDELSLLQELMGAGMLLRGGPFFEEVVAFRTYFICPCKPFLQYRAFNLAILAGPEMVHYPLIAFPLLHEVLTIVHSCHG